MFFLVEKPSDNREIKTISESKTTHAKYVRAIIKVILLIGFVIIMTYLIAKTTITPLIMLYRSYAFLLFVLMAIIALGEVFKLVTKKPYAFELSEMQESAVYLLGLSALALIKFVNENAKPDKIILAFPTAYPVLIDAIYAILQVSMFLVLYFFSLTFLLLIIRALVKIYRKLSLRKRVLKFKTKKSHSNLENLFWRSDEVELKIELNLDAKRWIKLRLYFQWFTILLFDVSIGAVLFFLHKMWKLTIILFQVIVSKMIIVLKSIADIENYLGRIVVYLSRLSIVLSFITVLVQEAYFPTLTDQGSMVFQFVCSVIIIPIAMQQFMEIRMHSTKTD
jgi:hypothetical protein